MNKQDSQNIVLIFLLSFITLSLFSIIIPVYQVSEAREGHVIKAMLETGEILFPLRLDSILPSKPPLFHWFSFSFAKFFNTLNSYTLRLTSILSSCFFLIAFYSFSKKFLPTALACICSLFLFTTYGFFNLGVDGRVDMLFNFLILSAVFIWLERVFLAYDAKEKISYIEKKYYLLISLLLGLSVLTKGPIGFVLPVILILISSYLIFGFKAVFQILRPAWLLAIIIPIIWYYFATDSYGYQIIEKQIFFENINRALGLKGITVKPWWFYLQHLFTQGLPWVFFILILNVNFLSVKDKRLKIILTLLFSIIFLLSFSAGKRRSYLLTALPFLILSIFLVLKNANRFYFKIRKSYSFLPVFLILLLFLPTTVDFLNEKDFLAKYSLTVLEYKKVVSDYYPYFLSISLVLSIASNFFISNYNNKRDLRNFLIVLLSFVFQIYLVFLPFLERVKYQTHSYDKIVSKVLSVVPKDSEIKVIKEDRDESLDVFFFYYSRPVKILRPGDLNRLNKGYYLISKINYEKLKIKPSIVSKLKRACDGDEGLFYLAKV